MTLDKQAPIAPGQPPLASNKPKAWASVRRKFALITMNRSTHAPSPDAQTAMSQAENFCRPFIQNVTELSNPRVASISESEAELELAFEKLTKENSARNVEITSATYSTPKTAGSRSRKKKKNRDKIVRFIEEPYIISDQEDSDGPDEPDEPDEPEKPKEIFVEATKVGGTIRLVEQLDSDL